MAGRRNSDKLTKWIQATTILLFLFFVIAVGYGLNRMFDEMNDITKGQQALILNLTQKGEPQTGTVTSMEKEVDQGVSQIAFIKYKNETDRELRELQKKVDLLDQKIKRMKSPL